MKKPHRRTHQLSRIRKRFAYSIDDVAKLFSVSKGTVHNWLKAGLKTIDHRRPYLIHGGDLFYYLKSRKESRKQPCGPSQIYCLRCRCPRRPYGMMVDVEFLNQVFAQVRGLCEECDVRMNRRSSVPNLAETLKAFDHVTLLNPHLIERLPPSLNCYLKDNKQ
jgi:hypothetical protein